MFIISLKLSLFSLVYRCNSFLKIKTSQLYTHYVFALIEYIIFDLNNTYIAYFNICIPSERHLNVCKYLIWYPKLKTITIKLFYLDDRFVTELYLRNRYYYLYFFFFIIRQQKYNFDQYHNIIMIFIVYEQIKTSSRLM